MERLAIINYSTTHLGLAAAKAISSSVGFGAFLRKFLNCFMRDGLDKTNIMSNIHIVWLKYSIQVSILERARVLRLNQLCVTVLCYSLWEL